MDRPGRNAHPRVQERVRSQGVQVRSHRGEEVNMSYNRNVSAARLSQRSGRSNAFGGYAKVNYGSGTFRMRPTR